MQNNGGPPDGELVRLGLSGESEALGTLVARYDRSAYHVAFGFLGNREEALDAVQTSVVKALQSLESLTSPNRFGSWFLRIVRNTALDRSEQIGRRRTSSLEHEGLSNDPGPVDSLLSGESVQELQSALRQLNEDQRTVLSLRYGQGWDYSRIAEMLDIPTSTVRSRLYEARLILKDKLLPERDGTEPRLP